MTVTCNTLPPDVSADEFNTYSVNVGAEISKEFPSSEFTWGGPSSIYTFSFNVISVENVRTLLTSLPDKSNTDVLGFDSKLLQMVAPLIAPVLTRLFDLSLTTGIVLDDWKTELFQCIKAKVLAKI